MQPVVALALHSHDDVADAAPGVGPPMQELQLRRARLDDRLVAVFRRLHAVADNVQVLAVHLARVDVVVGDEDEGRRLGRRLIAHMTS